MDMGKSVPVTEEMVKVAYKKVRANKGSAGVDEVSIEDFDKNKEGNLYKIWNRLSSGSYFPPPVKEVEIPKGDGKVRKLGIPTVGDRIAQMVIKDYLEPRLEKEFSPNSYGYRPLKSTHGALAQVRRNCWLYNWVIDLDIKGFFDNISHEKLLLAIDRHVKEAWLKMYIKRWLEMPIEKANGELIYKNGKGTPQGGVISPLLANLFLHYALDKWLMKTCRNVRFVRYADDVIVHCKNKEQAELVLSMIRTRLEECELELHPEKTKIVYCKDHKRTGDYENVKFDFLGFSFKPRPSKTKAGYLFLGFDLAISTKSRKRILEEIRKTSIQRWSTRTIEEIAKELNPKIRGWINYYGKYRPSKLASIFKQFHKRLIKWMKNKYKSLLRSTRRAYSLLKEMQQTQPSLFVHWASGYR
ncbi:MAG: group II intron reverse transcriptase/maturase [Bacteroidia bacterium]|nr:group II intron reverse transcriptase/maturase [Bacteroidia bacterium]